MSDSVEIKITGDPSGAVNAFVKVKDSARDFSKEIGQVSSEVVGEIGTMVAGFFTLGKGFEGLKDIIGETISAADHLHDLTASLGVLSSSARAGAESWKFFTDVQSHSRDTAQELASMYRDVLPVAMKRFGEEGTQAMTLMLSQMAPLAGKTAQDMDNAFQQLVMGRVRGTNPLLVLLGMSKEDFQNAGGFSDDMIQHMQSLAHAGEDLGQTFASTAHKIKEEWFDELAEGFNEMRGTANEGLTAMATLAADPQIKQFLHDAGAAAAVWAGNLAGVITELKGIGVEIGHVTDNPNWRIWLAMATLGASEAGRAIASGAAILGAAGNEQAASDLAASHAATGAGVLRNAGLIAPEAGGMAATGDISAFGDLGGSMLANIRTALPGLERYIGDLIAADHMTAGQVKLFTDQLRLNAVDASKAGLSLNPDDVMAAARDALKTSIHDTRAGAAEDTTAADTRAMQEQIRLIGEKAMLEEQALADAYKLTQLDDAGNKLALENDRVGYETLKQVLDLTTKRSQAELKLQDDLDRGATKEASNDRDYIAALSGRLAGVAATSAALSDLVNANYWQDLDAQEAQALNKADDNLLQFVSKSRDKLAEMPAAVAESVRASLKANKNAMDAQLADVFANVAFGGTFDPEMVKRITEVTLQQDESAVNAGERISKTLTDNIIHAETRFVQQFSTDFASIVDSGGHNFARIFASGFNQSVSEGVDLISKYLIGSPGDAKKAGITYAADGSALLVPQQAGHMYDPQGNDITGRSKDAQLAFAGVQDLASGYQAGRSGQSNSVLTSAIGGAVAGVPYAAESSGISVVVGAIVGMIGAELGKQAARADYKYGIPQIDAAGVAHFTDTQNYGRDKNTPPGTYTAQEMVVVRQIQSVYDSIHDSLAMIFIKAGALVPVAQGIYGKFQDAASGPFEQHLQQWESGTLPTELLGEVKGGLGDLATTFGMGKERFGAIFDALNNLDPAKAVQLLGTLFDALQSLDKVSAINHAQVSTPVGDYFSPFTAMYQGIEQDSLRNPGQIIAGMDDEILRLAGGLKDLSPENQITTLSQIASLNQNRYQAELQLAQQLFNLVKQIGDQADASVKGYQAQQILNADGSPDQYGLAKFYKASADQDLRDIQNAKNADQLSAAWAKYQQDVAAAEQNLYAQDPTKAGKTAAAQWGIDSEQLGKQIAEGVANAIGASLNPEDAVFNAKFDPLINAFKDGFDAILNGGGKNPVLGPDGNPVKNPDGTIKYEDSTGGVTTAFATLTTSANLLVPPVNNAIDAFKRLESAMNSFEDRINSLNVGTGSSTALSGRQQFQVLRLSRRAAS